MPYFNLPANPDNEMATGGGERKRRNWRFKGEVVESDPPGDVCQNRMTILVNGEEEITPRREAEACYVLPVRKRERM